MSLEHAVIARKLNQGIRWVSAFLTICLINLILMAFISLSGCVQAPVAPNLKLPEFDKMAIKEPLTCPTLSMPPVGSDVMLDIDGDDVTANKAGEDLLRYYVKARSILRP